MTKHTDKDIEQAARRFERLADSLDPATAGVSRQAARQRYADKASA